MKAYISLHTDWPRDQLDYEVSYEGYHRLEVDYDEERLKTDAIRAIFPVVTKVSDDTANYAAIGSASEGQDILHLVVPVREVFNPASGIQLSDFPERRTDAFWLDKGIPSDRVGDCIKAYGYTIPRVAIYDDPPVVYPSTLNPIAREAHRLVRLMLIRPAEIPHQLYAMINDELIAAGIPPIPVIRGGAATMIGDIRKMSLSQMGKV